LRTILFERCIEGEARERHLRRDLAELQLRQGIGALRIELQRALEDAVGGRAVDGTVFRCGHLAHLMRTS
jgi:hypothetical protein